MPGGKGINVARALKRLGDPVIATGLAGGRTGIQILDGLAGEGILNDFVRIARRVAHVDRGRRPDQRPADRDQRVRAGGDEPTSSATLLEKMRYLSGAVIDGGARRQPAAQGAPPGSTRTSIRDMAKRRVRTVIDSEGEPLRLALAAEPGLVSPNQREAEALVGPRVPDRRGLPARADRAAATWAPRTSSSR